MNIIRKSIYGAGLLLMASSLGSCDSFLQEYSQDLSKVNTWEDLDEVLLGDGYLRASRVYLQYGAQQIDRTIDMDFIHFLTDEMAYTDYDDVYVRDDYFSAFTWQQEMGMDTELRYIGGDDKLWNCLYKRINICNMVISLIDEQPENVPEDAVQKSRVKGEAYFLRAVYYFTLANLYCVPYNPDDATTMKGLPIKFTEYIEDKEFERETLADTYAKVLEDLESADQYLQGTTRKSVFHADVNAVHLLQSRVYLYMQDWVNAIAKAKEVLAANNKLMNVGAKAVGQTCLDRSCPELLFTMGDYAVAYLFEDASWHDPAFKISDDMLNLYDRNDYRATRYIGESDGGYEGVLTKVLGQRSTLGSYQDCGSVYTFRTAEAYLTLVEASAYNGDENTARQYLSTFMATRYAAPKDVTESGEALYQLIRDERAREFLLEGHRWFDLRRYTVNKVSPWSKEIVHSFNYFADYRLDRTDWYRLEKFDQAYTLPIPRSVRNFQPSLGNNPRPARVPFKSEAAGSGEDDDDDWDDEW